LIALGADHAQERKQRRRHVLSGCYGYPKHPVNEITWTVPLA
jgi:hypothetical protein